jgi:hypothetical protein
MILTGELFKAWKSCAQVKTYALTSFCHLACTYELILKEILRVHVGLQ